MDSRLILLFLLLLPVAASAEDCNGRRIYVRDLPPRFNTDLLRNCSAYSALYDDICPYLSNNGLGERTFNGSASWYRSDSAAMEPFFHHRVLEYSCLTDDPNSADAIFLPYYASLDALRYLYGPDLNSSSEHGLQLFEFLVRNDPQIWKRHNGYDHFLVMAGPAWDFSQSPEADPPIWGTSFLELPEFYNLTALVLESRPWPWQEQAIPYLTSFHPARFSLLESWLSRARRSPRPILMRFSGGAANPNSPPNIRRSISIECGNRTDLCEFVDCSNGFCAHDPSKFIRHMLRSNFCLQPPGNTPTRRSTFDAIIAGCIPVFFQEDSAKNQYKWHLPEEEYSQFSVLIPKEDVVAGGVSITDVLLAIPQVEVKKMRDRLLEIAPRVIYRRHLSSEKLQAKKDAFDLALEGTLAKIHRRIASPEEDDESSLRSRVL